jgi:tetratricopeptide (TPR) repeat protein
VHTHLQVLFGQAMFDSTHGYTLITCRFMASPELEWLKPLLQAAQSVPAAESKTALEAERTRDLVSHAAAMAQSRFYNRPAEALAALQPALLLNPDDDNALTVKGEILAQQGKLTEAEQSLRAALQKNAENERTHAVLAEVLARMNRSAEAMAEIATVKRISPLYPQVDQIPARLQPLHEQSSVAPRP